MAKRKRLYWKYFVTKFRGFKRDGTRARNFMGSPWGKDVRWSLPRGKRPGKWHVFRGWPIMCRQGFHAWITRQDLTRSSYAYPALRAFRVEIAGKTQRGAEKIVAQRMRLVRELTPREYKQIGRRRSE